MLRILFFYPRILFGAQLDCRQQVKLSSFNLGTIYFTFLVVLKPRMFCLRVDFHCRVIFTCVHVHVKMREVERDSPFTFTRDLLHIASLLLANVNVTHALT